VWWDTTRRKISYYQKGWKNSTRKMGGNAGYKNYENNEGMLQEEWENVMRMMRGSNKNYVSMHNKKTRRITRCVSRRTRKCYKSDDGKY
jgi:hypothetical protein